jgi:hypothetical protein
VAAEVTGQSELMLPEDVTRRCASACTRAGLAALLLAAVAISQLRGTSQVGAVEELNRYVGIVNRFGPRWI